MKVTISHYTEPWLLYRNQMEVTIPHYTEPWFLSLVIDNEMDSDAEKAQAI